MTYHDQKQAQIREFMRQSGWTMQFTNKRIVNGADSLFWYYRYRVTVTRQSDGQKLSFMMNDSPANSQSGQLPATQLVLEMINSAESEERTVKLARKFNYGAELEYSTIKYLVDLGIKVRAFLTDSEYEMLDKLASPSGSI
jgi:alanine-alpha-ketoisovalerate/valine-pyruvate aminotransferase